MLTRLMRRAIETAATLLAASFLIFSGMYAAPGSPIATIVGGPENISKASLQVIRQQYNLGEPFIVQYGLWLAGVFHGDLGRSYVYGEQVTHLLTSRLDLTLSLFVYAYVLIIAVGVLLGVLSAMRRGLADSAVVAGTTFLSGVPQFVAAIALIALFGVELEWFPVAGGGSGVLGRIYHLTLPAIALASVSLAVIARVTRQAMVEARAQDHVEVARSRGIPERAVVVRHVFRNALGPVATMSGLILAGMLGGSVLVETVFGLGGIGSLLVNAINKNDFPVVQAVLLLMVAFYIAVTTLTDLIYPLIDPRVTRGEGNR